MADEIIDPIIVEGVSKVIKCYAQHHGAYPYTRFTVDPHFDIRAFRFCPLTSRVSFRSLNGNPFLEWDFSGRVVYQDGVFLRDNKYRKKWVDATQKGFAEICSRIEIAKKKQMARGKFVYVVSPGEPYVLLENGEVSMDWVHWKLSRVMSPGREPWSPLLVSNDEAKYTPRYFLELGKFIFGRMNEGSFQVELSDPVHVFEKVELDNRQSPSFFDVYNELHNAGNDWGIALKLHLYFLSRISKP